MFGLIIREAFDGLHGHVTVSEHCTDCRDLHTVSWTLAETTELRSVDVHVRINFLHICASSLSMYCLQCLIGLIELGGLVAYTR